jgi:hypothetical protein
MAAEFQNVLLHRSVFMFSGEVQDLRESKRPSKKNSTSTTNGFEMNNKRKKHVFFVPLRNYEPGAWIA